jgi:beta-fructofuranosidase
MLMYTGVQEWQREDGYTESRQVQCVAYGDGKDYRKYEKNPVLTAEDLPEGASAEDFRDPKVWRDEQENCYYAVVGNRPADGSGSILLFRSEDTMNWSFVTVLERCKNQYGKMWECPDFFMLDHVAVILTSPQEMRARGMEFHNGYGNIYITGYYDKETHQFERTEVRAIDYGLDFYAPQTVLTPDGRRVMIGWMQSWETSHSQPHGTKWFGMMTIPRELHIVNGRLIQSPISELVRYHSEPVLYRDVDVRERIQLPQVCGRTLDMTVYVRPAGGKLYDNFTIKVAKSTEDYTSISYNPSSSILKFDRSNSGFRHDIIATREVLVRYQSGEIQLRIIMDRFSVEIFVNDGQQVISSTIYTPLEAESISFEANGMAIIDVEKYDIVIPESQKE